MGNLSRRVRRERQQEGVWMYCQPAEIFLQSIRELSLPGRRGNVANESATSFWSAICRNTESIRESWRWLYGVRQTCGREVTILRKRCGYGAANRCGRRLQGGSWIFVFFR